MRTSLALTLLAGCTHTPPPAAPAQPIAAAQPAPKAEPAPAPPATVTEAPVAKPEPPGSRPLDLVDRDTPGTTTQPLVEIAQPKVAGGLAANIVADVLWMASDKLGACYATAGTMTVTFRIAASGKVMTASASGMKLSETCVARALEAIAFPVAKTPTDVTDVLAFSSGAFASLTGTGDISSGFDDTNIYAGLLGDGDGDKAAGTTSGGIGWGTIGTGRYGTVGHGSGTSSGYGVSGHGGMRGKAAVPTVSLGQPTAKGDLDKAIIRRYIKRNLQKIEYCFERQLLTTPDLTGTATIVFVIGVDGKVTSSTGSGLPKVDDCVAGVVREIEFPKPKNNAAVQVTYPFKFRPAA